MMGPILILHCIVAHRASGPLVVVSTDYNRSDGRLLSGLASAVAFLPTQRLS